jgi:hypothetical protein
VAREVEHQYQPHVSLEETGLPKQLPRRGKIEVSRPVVPGVAQDSAGMG